MSGSLTRLRQTALRPLWREEEELRARRRCRTVIATPFAALAGLAWGVFAAPSLVSGSPLFWGTLGAFTFPFFMYVEQRLAPMLARVARRLGLGNGHLAATVAEAGMVGAGLYVLTGGLGAPVVPAAGTALGIGAFYAFVMEYVLCGEAASDVAGLIHGGGRGGTPKATGMSHAQALAARGALDEAADALEDLVRRHPREAAPYVELARVQVAGGRYELAVETLRTGLRKVQAAPASEAFMVRQIHEICRARLDAPSRALPDLHALVERQGEGVHAEWARREIEELTAGEP